MAATANWWFAREGEGRGCGRVDFDNAAFDLDADLNLQNALPDLDSNNYNHDVALLLGLAAGAGLIEQADISATSSVDNILNAQVDSTASAFGNLKSIAIETGRYDNGLVMGDISQLSVANVSANRDCDRHPPRQLQQPRCSDGSDCKGNCHGNRQRRQHQGQFEPGSGKRHRQHAVTMLPA